MAYYSELLPFFYQALAARWGIVLSTPDPDTLKARLYKARSQHDDPLLSGITIQTSRTRPTSEVWLLKSDLKSAKALPKETHSLGQTLPPSTD